MWSLADGPVAADFATSSAAVGVWATSTRQGAVGGSPIAAAVAPASSSA